MSRISLWSPNKGNDFNFTDRVVGENFRIAGDGILVHEYIGPTTDANGSTETTLTTIQDVLFLANNNRKYNPNVIEMKGHHVPTDTNYDLSQFGIFLSSDVIRVQFHYNDMIDLLGRKLIAGDVLEFPSMVDIPIFDNAVGINRYYVVQDALWGAAGYGQTWFPHIWLVRAKLMNASVEFTEILDQAATGQTQGGLGQGIGIMPDGFSDTADENGNPGTGANHNITSSLNLFCQIIGITDANVVEAQNNAFFDPKFFESNNLWIYLDPDTNFPIIGSYYFAGSGTPPDGGPLIGAGISFPTGMQNGEYFLRIDYFPERLYQKQDRIYKLIQEDILKTWTATNRILDTFIDNNNITTLSDGTTMPEKQAVSQIGKQRVDLYAERRTNVLSGEATRAAIADKHAQNTNINPESGATSGITNPYISPNPNPKIK